LPTTVAPRLGTAHVLARFRPRVGPGDAPPLALRRHVDQPHRVPVLLLVLRAARDTHGKEVATERTGHGRGRQESCARDADDRVDPAFAEPPVQRPAKRAEALPRDGLDTGTVAVLVAPHRAG